MATWPTPGVDDDGSGSTGTILNDAYFDAVKAYIDDGYAAWTPYTPSWSNLGGTLPVIGNGVLTGRYLRAGKTVHFVIALNPGSTTTFGDAGNLWVWGLPLNILSIGALNPMSFPVSMLTGAGAAVAPAIAIQANAGSILVITSTGGIVGPTVPFTWSTGAQLYVRGTYETA